MAVTSLFDSDYLVTCWYAANRTRTALRVTSDSPQQDTYKCQRRGHGGHWTRSKMVFLQAALS
eukprot:3814978-Amphidinium_carterae.1